MLSGAAIYTIGAAGVADGENFDECRFYRATFGCYGDSKRSESRGQDAHSLWERRHGRKYNSIPYIVVGKAVYSHDGKQ